MKTLGKLNINSEKIMKNEELETLRGGYDQCEYWCCVYDGPYPSAPVLYCGVGCGESAGGAQADCVMAWAHLGFDCHCW
jgi:hypothetical protein